MTTMDREAVIAKLESFIELFTTKFHQQSSDFMWSGEHVLVHPEDRVQATAQQAETILDRILPNWRNAPWMDPEKPYSHHRTACLRAVSKLQSDEELSSLLGDGAPDLSASSLHPWAWDAAQPLWDNGHYREAVNATARMVNAEAQNKLSRRDLSEWKLLEKSFSLSSAGPADPRLRLMQDDGSDTFKTLHNGAGGFCRGAFQAIRNPANHAVLEDLPEHEALEQLAAFSIIARWIDAATVERDAL